MRQVLEQYISDFSTHKNHLELLLKQRFLGPPLDSDLVDWERGYKFAFQMGSQVMVMRVVQGLAFKQKDL